jgi:ATP adenylyltransferase
MLVVPRSAEFWEGISVNALGFAGSLFVRDMDQLETVRRRGPFAVLSGVGMPLAAVDPEG